MFRKRYAVYGTGTLSESACRDLRPLRVERHPGETIVHGPIESQPGLVLLLHRLERLGLDVVGYRMLVDVDEAPAC